MKKPIWKRCPKCEVTHKADEKCPCCHAGEPRVFTLAGGYLLAEGLLLKAGHNPRDHARFYVFHSRILVEQDFNPAHDNVLTCPTFEPRFLADHANIIKELEKRGFKCSQG